MLAPETRDFSCELLGFTLRSDSDWFVNLASASEPRCELAKMSPEFAASLEMQDGIVRQRSG